MLRIHILRSQSLIFNLRNETKCPNPVISSREKHFNLRSTLVSRVKMTDMEIETCDRRLTKSRFIIPTIPIIIANFVLMSIFLMLEV